jgi:hypothetical protein
MEVANLMLYDKRIDGATIDTINGSVTYGE